MQSLNFIQPVLNDSTRYSIRYEERLAMALNFNLDDLTANRLGAITARQANRMRARMLNDAGQMGIILLAGVAVVVLLAALRSGLTTSADDAEGITGTLLLILMAAAAVATLGFVLHQGLSAYHFYKDTQKMRSALAQGYLKLEGPAVDKMPLPLTENGASSSRRWKSTRFYAVLDGKRFLISEVACIAMKKGEPYVIYYAPQSKYILSAERLRNEREFANNSGSRPTGRPEVQPSRP